MRSFDRRFAMKQRFLAALVTAASLLSAEPARAADTARDMYNRALAQERQVRDDAAQATAAQMRRVVVLYETIVRRHPASGYSDNALWQAANLAALAYDRFGSDADRRTAARLFTLLAKEYPSSKLVARATGALNDLNAPAPAPPVAAAAIVPAPPSRSRAVAAPPAVPETIPAVKNLPEQKPRGDSSSPALLKEIRRTVLPDGIRLTVDLDAEVSYHQEEIANPRRVFFDLKGVKAAPA